MNIRSDTEEMRPFTTFNYSVEIMVPNLAFRLCKAAFSECSGLEMNLEHKTIREGGNNAQQIHLAGPVSYGQLTLRRGMTSTGDLWDWFEMVAGRGGRGMRAAAVVRMLDTAGQSTTAVFHLEGCLPVRLRAPSLNALGGDVAIEEMSVAYETMRMETLGGGLAR